MGSEMGIRDSLEAVFDKLKGRGRLSEADVESALREVRRLSLIHI